MYVYDVRALDAREIKSKYHQLSPGLVAALLQELEYSLQANRKTREGASHPDRNACAPTRPWR